MFFISEYYDNVIRSIPREQFRWMIEQKGYKVQYNNDKIEQLDDIEITISNKILYSRYESLTDSEKLIYEKAKNYAKFLNVDFNSKVAKKKSEDILLSDKLFIKHFAFRMLMGNVPTKQQMKKQYNISVSSSLYQKIEMIKQLEKIINIKTLEINTKFDVDRFDKVVGVAAASPPGMQVDDDLKDNIIKIFRYTESGSNMFRFWYYRLIKMYKSVLDSNIFKYSECKRNNDHYSSYSINNDIYDKFRL